MLVLLLLSLWDSSARGAASTAPAAAAEPPVRVWLSSDGKYSLGDRAKVYARVSEDGYVVVLRADARGQVRVLFPIEPQSDGRVRAGKKYELKGRGGREAFVVDDTAGRGTVLAAFSKSPFRFDEFQQRGHWDYQALSGQALKDDPEAGLMEIVRRMQPETHFDYDVASYVASPSRYARYGRYHPYPYPGLGWWDYWYGPRLGVSFWLGPRYYYRPFVYAPFGWGFGGRRR